jgi:hypothetical protein
MPGVRFDRKHRVIAVAAALQTRGFDVRGVRDGRECRVVDARAQRTSGLQHHSERPERNLRSRSRCSSRRPLASCRSSVWTRGVSRLIKSVTVTTLKSADGFSGRGNKLR